MTSSKHNYLLKAPLPNTTPLGVRASTHEFCGDTNIIHNTCQLLAPQVLTFKKLTRSVSDFNKL